MEHKCPHCGASLPEHAAFCPHCAQSVQPRKAARKPVPWKKKLLLGLVVLAAVAAAGMGLRQRQRHYVPQEFDGVGEVYYETGDKTYQLLVAWPNDRCMPAPDIYQQGVPDEQHRWPSRWYVNDAATGQDAWAEFEPLVEQVAVEVVQDETAEAPLTATVPSHDDYSPDAAMVSYLDFTGGSGEPQVVWTVQMANGDLIRVRQNLHITPILTHEYHWEDYPMDTLEELQDLMDQIAAQVSPSDKVLLYLPPVTYEGDLELPGRSFELHGSAGEAGRTTLTGSVTMLETGRYNWISCFYDMDFVGNGSNTGITASQKAWAVGCSFTGYQTGLLTQGGAWVNVTECTFTGNEVGFLFNSTGQSASDDRYFDNTFTDNGTAVLLMSVPTDMTLYFDGTTFSGNGADIDNRCGHSVDTSNAIFR